MPSDAARPAAPRRARLPADPRGRPFAALPLDALAGTFAAALAAGDGLAGAHCVHELATRGEPPHRVETARERLWAACAATIPEWLPMRHVEWLPLAYDVAGSFRAQRRGRFNVYLVLLDNATRRGSDYGVYVGMTGYEPAQRFDQHKAGIRAAGCVLKRGLELLAGPVLHLRRISRAEAAAIERDLAVALADAGIAVEGGH
jgi:hypothetical protein